MIQEFFAEQADYLIFLCGLAGLILAVVSASMSPGYARTLPWRFLVAGGICFCFAQWLELIPGESRRGVAAIRLVVLTASFSLLLEFGRAGARMRGFRAPDWRVHPVLLSMVALGLWGGVATAEAVARSGIALPGWLAVAVLFFREARRTGSKSLLVAASASVGNALMTGLAPLTMPLFAAADTDGGAASGMSVRIVMTLCLALTSAGIWRDYHWRRDVVYAKSILPRDLRVLWAEACLVVILAGGWLLTESAGRFEFTEDTATLVQEATFIASAISPEHLAVPELLPPHASSERYQHLVRHLSLIVSASTMARSCGLYFPAPGGPVRSAVVSRLPNPVRPPVDREVQSVARVLKTGQAEVSGRYQSADTTVIACTAPVRNSDDNRVVAALVIEFSAGPLLEDLRRHRLPPIVITMTFCVFLLLLTVYRHRLQEGAQRLAESEQRYRALFEKNGAVMLLIDPESGEILDANAAAASFYGWSREQLRQMVIGEITTTPASELRDMLCKAMSGGIARFQFRHRLASWDERDVEVRPAPYQYNGRQCLLTVIHDISGQKQMEVELQAMYDGMTEGTILVGLADHRVHRVNRRAGELFGYGETELIGKSIAELHPPAMLEEVAKLFGDFMVGQSVSRRDLHCLRSDGSLFLADVGYSRIHVADCQYVVGFFHDVTQRRQVEQRMEESRDEWMRTFDAVPELIAILDQQFRIRSVNKAMAAALGVAPAEAVGLRCHDMVHGAGVPPLGCPHKLLLQDGQGRAQEVYEPALGGHLLVTVSPLYDADGVLIGSVHIARDISDHKRSEAQMQASLREKEAMLREVHQRVKNNMQVIFSLMNLQAVRSGDDRFRLLVRESLNRLRTMTLIHENLYRSETLVTLDFRAYLEELVHQLAHDFAECSDIRLVVEVEPLVFDMDTAVPCGLMVNELVSNAFNHAFPEGDGEVKIRLQRDETGFCVLTVTDNGSGFPAPSDVNAIQTGGLELVEDLARQLRGTMEIERSAGTMVRIRFRAPDGS